MKKEYFKVWLGGGLLYLAGIIVMTEYAVLSLAPALIGWIVLDWWVKTKIK